MSDVFRFVLWLFSLLPGARKSSANFKAERDAYIDRSALGGDHDK